MGSVKRLASLAAGLAVAASAVVSAAPPAPAVIAAIDLTGPFATRSPWRFTATQEATIDDPILAGKAPGEVRLCLRKGASGLCDAQLQEALRAGSQEDLYARPHYLNKVQIVQGDAGAPLLLVQTASLHGANNGHLIFTQALAYRRGADQFVRVYGHLTGSNNNQEVRFIERGRLKGDIISAEPTENAPFGFWMSVNALTPGRGYAEVLRYRSATRYGDGNRLSVIDSEMANIERRLGLWRPGSPLPVPAGRCPAQHLIHLELWCG